MRATGNGGIGVGGARLTIDYAGPNLVFNAAQQRFRPWLLLGFTRAQQVVPPIFFAQL